LTRRTVNATPNSHPMSSVRRVHTFIMKSHLHVVSGSAFVCRATAAQATQADETTAGGEAKANDDDVDVEPADQSQIGDDDSGSVIDNDENGGNSDDSAGLNDGSDGDSDEVPIGGNGGDDDKVLIAGNGSDDDARQTGGNGADEDVGPNGGDVDDRRETEGDGDDGGKKKKKKKNGEYNVQIP
jgi:hypothetical protein